jgi:hypothetical protein
VWIQRWRCSVNDVSKILIPLVSGSRVRNFLRTDLFTELRNNADIVILSPAYNDEAFLREFGYPRVFHEAYYPKAPRRGIETFLQTLETWFPNPKYASTHTYQSIVESLSHASARGKIRKLQLRLLKTELVSRYTQTLRALCGRLDFLLDPPAAYYVPFERHTPTLVFTDYPFHYCYRPLLKIARRRRIPVVCFVTSWDNLTSKGELPMKMDKMIVWNEIMKTESIELYGCDPEDIFVSGAPQFDIYFRKDSMMPRSKFLSQLGFDRRKRTITYCTQGMRKYETLEFEAIKMLLAFMRDHSISDECQLLIRLHPNASPERFLGLRKEGVYIDCPGRSELWLDGWDPEGADMGRLANILHSSDVVVNIASTITIDACCLDRPVVNLAFDADRPRPYWDSVARFYDWTHYKNIVRTGGVRLARSKEELLKFVQAYLQNPSLDAEGRKRIVSEQCYYTDGMSGKRVARFVLDFLRSNTSQRYHRWTEKACLE